MALEGQQHPQETLMRRRGPSGAGARGLVCLPGVREAPFGGVQQGPQESSAAGGVMGEAWRGRLGRQSAGNAGQQGQEEA